MSRVFSIENVRNKKKHGVYLFSLMYLKNPPCEPDLCKVLLLHRHRHRQSDIEKSVLDKPQFLLKLIMDFLWSRARSCATCTLFPLSTSSSSFSSSLAPHDPNQMRGAMVPLFSDRWVSQKLFFVSDLHLWFKVSIFLFLQEAANLRKGRVSYNIL